MNFDKFNFYFAKKGASQDWLNYVKDDSLSLEMPSSNFEGSTQKKLKIGNNDINDFRKMVKKYDKYPPLEIFQEYYDKIGPLDMLDVLEEDKFCHSESHRLGMVIFNRTHNFVNSMNICGSRCSSGCFHGVLMGLFKEILPRSIFNDSEVQDDTEHIRAGFGFRNISKILQNICDVPEITKFIVRGNCFHGIGHALLFIADYNISKGLEFCKSLNEKAAVYYCATGIFMEYDTVSHDFNSDNKFSIYPCNIAQEFPAACFRYKVRRLFNSSKNPKEVAEWCLQLDNNQQLGCFHGLGYATYKYIYKRPQALIDVCLHGTKEDQKMCIDGAVELIAIADTTVAETACNFLSDDIKEYCFKEIQYKTFNLKKPLDLYYNINRSK